jgi:hypothetical protein
MGGVHANMAASLFPGPVALAPLLAPRSAAGAYCSGALYHATAWSRVGGEVAGSGEGLSGWGCDRILQLHVHGRWGV